MHHSKSNIPDPPQFVNPETLFLSNRPHLKSIFSQHNPQDNKISFSEFCKFCRNAQIFPDLISMLDIKRVVTRSTQYQNSRSSLTYQNFELCLKYIAIAAYQGLSLSDKLCNLFQQISAPCKEAYNAHIILTKQSRTNTPLSCDTSRSEYEDNRNSNKVQMVSYAEKQFLKRKTMDNNLNSAWDINTAAVSRQSCSPRDSKSTSRIRASPKIVPSYSNKTLSKEPSPLQNKSLTTKRKEGYQAISEIKKISQEFLEKSKNLAAFLSVDKKHYRTLSGGTYISQSPKFGGGSTLIALESERDLNVTDRRSSNNRRSIDSNSESKEKNIEKLFFKFREGIKKTEELKPDKKNEPYMTSLRKHRNYITKVRSNEFSGGMVMRMIFTAWKGLVNSKHPSN
ncbi:unnamed protein product [Blepharisma stoltei]|uniref:EF-hand domain-containing protein n=1 Tax=Blepharisma stoltei TaxID=1481888 RepID=A0AAU9J4T1_9CILI|nr:unnamed protein product [Blepharisma stoltei]